MAWLSLYCDMVFVPCYGRTPLYRVAFYFFMPTTMPLTGYWKV